MSDLEEELRPYEDLDPDSPYYERIRNENKRLARETDELIHRVFEQNEDGKKLLEMLTNRIVFAEMYPSMKDRELRHRAGKHSLVMEFISAVKKVKAGY